MILCIHYILCCSLRQVMAISIKLGKNTVLKEVFISLLHFKRSTWRVSQGRYVFHIVHLKRKVVYPTQLSLGYNTFLQQRKRKLSKQTSQSQVGNSWKNSKKELIKILILVGFQFSWNFFLVHVNDMLAIGTHYYSTTSLPLHT